MSLAVVGAAHPNKRGPTRRFGINLCRPGDPIELRPEPKNPADENAIAVFGHDIQLGYLRSERAAWFARVMASGREVTAIYQEAADYGCVIRVGFDGEPPALPSARPGTQPQALDFAPDPIPENDFSDPIYDE
jgi:hypothetical protein